MIRDFPLYPMRAIWSILTLHTKLCIGCRYELYSPGVLPQHLLQGIGLTRTTWEYRWATNAVWTQFIVGGTVIAWFWKTLPPQVPLWYSKPWGDERLASPWFLFLPLLSSIIVYR